MEGQIYPIWVGMTSIDVQQEGRGYRINIRNGHNSGYIQVAQKVTTQFSKSADLREIGPILTEAQEIATGRDLPLWAGALKKAAEGLEKKF